MRRLFGSILAGALAAAAGTTSCRTVASDASPAEGPPPAQISQAVLFHGQPFPERPVFAKEPPAPARTFYVSSKAAADGNGSREKPWKDIATGLRALSPGDRLSVGAGEYAGPIRIDETCRAGTEGALIQVVFDGATFPAAGGRPVLTASRPYWRFERLSVELEDDAGAAFAVEGGTRGVVLDRARINGGAGVAVRIGDASSEVTVANSFFFRRGRGGAPPGALAVAIDPGSSRIRIVDNAIFDRPSGAIRVGPPSGEAVSIAAPRDVVIEGNTVTAAFSPAILVTAGDGVRVSANTIQSRAGAGGPDGRGIVVEAGSRVRIERNHVVDASTSVQVGWNEPGGAEHPGPSDVLVAGNYFERRASTETVGVDVEAGANVRIANNVFEEIADPLVIFGAPPKTSGLVVANNLFLELSGTAFRADDLTSAVLFDANIFSPRSGALAAEIGGVRRDLRTWVSHHMHRSQVVAGVRMVHKDLDRIEGVATRGAGIPVPGVDFGGRPPDLGIPAR